MSEAEVFELIRAHAWGAVKMCTPILLTALVVGLIVGLVQALTSIQELTLTFVPKMIAVVVVFILTVGYMTKVCLDLFHNHVLPYLSA